MGKKSETPKPAAAIAPATKVAAAKKPAAKAKKTTAKSPVAKAKKAIAAKVALTTEDIALRAYFIAEKRQKAGLPGNAHHDWIEAEKQLLAEGKKRSSAK